MITSPLDLKSHIRKPTRHFDVAPLFDVLLIGLFFGLFWSDIVIAPGLTINLPNARTHELSGSPASAVLTVRPNEMFLFEGRILSPESLGPALREQVMTRGPVHLLIQFDRDVSVQTFLSISETAREAGVARIVLAAKPQAQGETLAF